MVDFVVSMSWPLLICSYVERMKAGQREIFYLCAPSRELADTSPYMETLSASGKDYTPKFMVAETIVSFRVVFLIE